MLRPSRAIGPLMRACRNARHDEDGMTLVELSVTMVIALTIMLLMGTMLTVFTKAEASTVNSANAASQTRLALLQFQHDVQSAVPLQPLSGGSGNAAYTVYDDELQVTIQPSGAVITWQYDPTTQKVTRTLGGVPVVELTNVTNGCQVGTGSSGVPCVPLPAGQGLPVFKYFDACGNDLVAQALAASPQPAASTIAANATVVQVTLAVQNLDSAPYGTTTSVNIMNKTPGIVTSC